MRPRNDKAAVGIGGGQGAGFKLQTIAGVEQPARHAIGVQRPGRRIDQQETRRNPSRLVSALSFAIAI